VQLIREQKNDYVIGVKANQQKLYQQLRELAQSDAVWSVDLQRERTRNRQTQRVAAVFELPASIRAQWADAQVGVTVVRWGTRGDKPYFEQRYYISSWRERAEALQERIRAHWGIENPLHWVKDVVMGEDESSICTKGAAAVMGMVRNLAITLFRRAGHHSITAAIDLLGNDLDQLLPMLGLPSS
jgi:predicted transposase YbfD/YdcC